MGGGIAQVVAARPPRDASRFCPGAVDRGLKAIRRVSRSSPRRAVPIRTRCSRASSPGRDRRGRSDDRGGGRGRVGEGGRCSARATRCSRERDPRLQHLVDPDRPARRRQRTSRPRHRHALLQPGAADGPGRGRPRSRDLGGDCGAIVELARELGKTPAESNDFPGFVSNRIPMPLINEAAYARHGGCRRGGGDRHDREARPQSSSRPAGARRPYRARHVRGHHGGREQGSATRSTRHVRSFASTYTPGGWGGRPARGSLRTTPLAPVGTSCTGRRRHCLSARRR